MGSTLAVLPRTALLVDDVTARREVVHAAVTSMGWAPRETAELRDVVSMCRATRPSAILFGCDARSRDQVLQALDAIRTLDTRPPVLLIAEQGSEALAVAAFRAGVFDYLSFPLDGRELSAILARCVSTAPASLSSADTKPASWPAGRLHRLQPRHATRADLPRPGSARRCERPHHGRDRHRQGTGRRLPARAQRPPAAGGSFRSTVRPFRTRCSRASSSATSAARSPARTARTTAWLAPMVARSSSTKSATWRCRAGEDPARHRNRASVPASGAASASRSTSASSRRPTRISTPRSRRVDSARISTTGCTSRRSACRRCASGAETSGNCSITTSTRSTHTPHDRFTCRRMPGRRSNAYEWPGNVRELKNLVESLFVCPASGPVRIEDLPEAFRRRLERFCSAGDPERRALLDALFAARWNKSRAAEILECSRMTLYRRMAKYSVVRSSYDPSAQRSVTPGVTSAVTVNSRIGAGHR